MRTRLFFKIVSFVLLAFFCAKNAVSHADTITGSLYTNPVSIALPTPIGVSSNPVSIALPTPIGVSSRPVSIAMPTAIGVYSKPISLSIQPQAPSSDPTLTPTVAASASPTNSLSVSLSGTKQANTYIYINNQLAFVSFAATTWSASVTLAMEGSNTFSVFARDGSGNQSQAVTATVVRDTIPPALDVSALSDGSYTNNKTQNVSGTVADANLSQLAVNGQPVAVTNGVFSTAVTLAPGDNAITVAASDLAENVTTNTRTLHFDTTPPAITITAPADGSYTNLPTATVTGSVDKSASVTVAGAAATMDGLNFSATVNLIEGLNTIEVVATDLYGNVASLKRTITADNVKPEVSITTPSQDIASNQKTLTISGTVSQAIPVVVTSTFNGATAPVPVTGGAFSFTVDFSGLLQGTYPILLTVTDAAGNVTTATRTIIYDTTAPSFTIDPVPAQTGTATLTVTGTVAGTTGVSDGVTVFNPATNANEPATITDGTWSHDITLVPGPNTITAQAQDAAGNVTARTATITYLLPAPSLAINPVGPYVTVATPVITGTVDAGATVNVSANGGPAVAATITGATWSCTLAGLPQGGNSITATAAGQYTYSATTSASFTLDTIPPAVPVINPPPSPTRNASLTLTGAKEANSYLYVNGQLTAVPFADPAWSYAATLAEGTNSFTVYAKDPAGNQSPAATASVVLDTKAPVVVSSSPAANAFVRSVTGITMNLSDAASGVDFPASLTGASVKNAAGAPVAGSWSASGTNLVFTPPAPLPDDTYTVTVSPVDLAGNTTTASFAFTVDSIPPAAPGIDPVPALINTANRTLTGTRTGDSTSVVVACAGATVGTVSYPTATSWSVSVTGLKEGSNTVTASALDAAGNQSGAATISFTVDTIPPATPVITPPASPTRVDTVTLTWTKESSSSLYLNGQAIAAPFADTTWSYTATLAEGDNTFVVYARDAAGNQSPSVTTTVLYVPQGTALVGPSPPVNLTAAPLAGGKILFTWQAGAMGTPVGYNLYEVPASFTALTDPGVRKVNSALIADPVREYVPADDTPRFYVVTAVDGGGIESAASTAVAVASDRDGPAVSKVRFGVR